MTSFGTKLRGNEKLAKLADKLQNGTAAYADAYEYALEVGTALSDTFGEELSSDVLPDGKMYFNIANRVVRDPLTRAYRLIADECEGVQEKLNTAAGIGLKALRPDYPENRIKGFIDRLSSEPDYDKVSWMLKEPVKTFSESIVDDSVKKNADFHYKAGLSPQIIRTAAAGCCEWCAAVEGTYPYPNVPKDIYRRHNFCRCQVEYDPKTGRRQDVHTRRWSDQEGYVRYREIDETERIRKRVLKNSDDVFITIDARTSGGKDVIKPKNIRKDLMKSPQGIKALEKIKMHGTSVFIEYGLDPIDVYGEKVSGLYDPIDNAITIFASETKTVKETARTLIHEAFHIDDNGSFQLSEVRSYVQEKRHDKRGAALTRQEVEDIINFVKERYPELPWRA